MTEQEKQVLADRIQSVQERIARAAERAGRSPDDIILVAASKSTTVRLAYKHPTAHIE